MLTSELIFSRKGNFSSTYKALVKKEFKRLFTSPTYAVNSCMGLVFTLIVIGLIIYLAVEGLLGLITKDMAIIGLRFLPTFIAFTFTLAPTTACCISIEGKTFWLMKTLPVETFTYFKAKLTVNFIINTLVALVLSVALCIIFGLTFEYVLLAAIIALALPTFSGTFGLLMDLRFANFKWKTEQEVAKSGVALMLSVLASFVLTAILGVTAYLWGMSNVLIYLIIVAFALIILNGIIFAILAEKGEKMLNKLN